MKQFNIIEEFHQLNVSGLRHVTRLISQLAEKGMGTERDITLNLEGCQTDYPVTPFFIDYFLNHLTSIQGHKTLTILFNALGTEIYLLYDVVLEGNYFDIHEKAESEKDLISWKQKINNKLIENHITMILKNTSETPSQFVYGEKLN